jgi:hypothetical protein
VDDLIYALLAADPFERPASAAEVFAALSGLAGPRPPIPGVVTEGPDPVRAYSTALIGQTVHADQATEASHLRPVPDRSPAEAERLFTSGQTRAAARMWRELAEERARQHGDEDRQVFDWRLRTARAHVHLGESDRALRLLDSLLVQRIDVDGPDHSTVHQLRQEIAELRGRQDPLG